ncbi:MAG: hypothetical protein OXE78_14980 [Gammaproteobacteria bacterium]|nr:hypothetical protein [Gammaproteobacteria bacterium]
MTTTLETELEKKVTEKCLKKEFSSMELFRIHIRPSYDSNVNADTFKYCLNHNLLGVGWRVGKAGVFRTTDWEIYKKAATNPPYDGTGEDYSIQQPQFIFKYVKRGDLVWTRDTDSHYYLAQVTSG